jgi:hypothetical protein
MATRATPAKGPWCAIEVQRFGPFCSDASWDWRAQAALEDRILVALASVLPTLVRDRSRDYPGRLWAVGEYTLALDDTDLADTLGAAVWAANGGFCHVTVYRFERGQFAGQGRQIVPEPAGIPGNSLGLSDLELDEILASIKTDDGERELARFIDMYLLTSEQRRILAEHGVLVSDLNDGEFPISLASTIDKMFADWNARSGQKLFVDLDETGLIESIEDNLDADFYDDPGTDGLSFRPR